MSTSLQIRQIKTNINEDVRCCHGDELDAQIKCLTNFIINTLLVVLYKSCRLQACTRIKQVYNYVGCMSDCALDKLDRSKCMQLNLLNKSADLTKNTCHRGFIGQRKSAGGKGRTALDSANNGDASVAFKGSD